MTWTLDLGDVLTVGSILLGAAALYYTVLRRQDALARDVKDLQEDKVEIATCIERKGEFKLLSERVAWTQDTVGKTHAALLAAGHIGNPPELLPMPQEEE